MIMDYEDVATLLLRCMMAQIITPDEYLAVLDYIDDLAEEVIN